MKRDSKRVVLHIIDEMLQIHHQMQVGMCLDSSIFVELKQAANTIANYLQTFEADGIIIDQLHEYCDYVTQFTDDAILKLNNIAIEMLKQIRDSIRGFFSNYKKKILFIPYKASMWDAFDTVYRYISENTGNDVRVMPIPYYNMELGKNIIAEFYEGYDFPSYLNILDYKKYDFDKEEPDVIFIHNPYDQYNYVTRIDENFFSGKLARYTDHLVYIPYDVANDQTFDLNMTIMPGVVNSWRIYVQSDMIRQKYLKRNNANKIVALGTPKLDCVINQKYLSQYIGDDLKIRISERKTFFLNTHLSSILVSESVFFENILYILQKFKENKDIFLIWRPHPLLRQTAESMNRKYVQLLEKVYEMASKMENCYLDLSPDMHEAIAVSDAYVGDRGSLMLLYGATGKPMYLVDNSLIQQGSDKLRIVRFLDCYEEENYIWMFSVQYNAVFQYDKRTNNTKYVGNAKSEKRYSTLLYRECFKWKDKLVFVPLMANKLLIVQEQKDTTKLVECELGGRNSATISTAIQQENILWMVSHFLGDDVFELNMNTNQISYHKVKGLENIGEYDKSLPFWNVGVADETGIWLSSYQRNIIGYYNYSCFEIYKIDREGETEGFQGCAFDGESIWLLPKEGTDICIWNRETKQVSSICTFPKTIKVGKHVPFKRILYCNQKMWVLPNNCNRIFSIDMKNYEIDVINITFNGKSIDFKEGDIEWAKISNNCLIVSPYKLDYEIRIDTVTNVITYKKYYIPEKWDKDYLTMYANIHTTANYVENYMFHSTSCGFDWFIDYVLGEKDKYQDERRKNTLNGFAGLDGNAGEKIWNDILNEIRREEI